MDAQDYRVLTVEPRKAYDTAYGTMQPYAITLEGVDGFVQLSQKPETEAPVVGQALHGYTYEQQGPHGGFLKFKKVNPNYDNNNFNSGSKPGGSVNNDRVIELLEAIAEAVGAKDVVPNSEEVDEEEPIDLSAIPF